MMPEPPSIADIQALQASLAGAITRTPMLRCAGLEAHIGTGARIWAKLEFLQRTGTFKARGALSIVKSLSAKQIKAGVTAVSAGNHAVATAYAAKTVGASAKVVMIDTSNPSRIAACRSYGADILFTDDVHDAFNIAENIREQEGRYLVHPYEGPQVATGTGTIGLEICEDCDAFDAVLVSIGGGGLMGGIANAVKQLRPECKIIGVEPEGADSMHRSFAAGEPCAIEEVRTIADSLGAPFALPYSFELCRNNVDRLVSVNDNELRKSMGLLFRKMKIAVEPACVATTAALVGPLRDSLAGKNVVLVMCGSNIDWATFAEQAIFEE